MLKQSFVWAVCGLAGVSGALSYHVTNTDGTMHWFLHIWKSMCKWSWLGLSFIGRLVLAIILPWAPTELSYTMQGRIVLTTAIV
jgi:hypothetical protein